MKRNTALRWIGWLGTFAAVGLTPLYREIRIQALLAVAHLQYEFPLPTNLEKLGVFVKEHPEAKDLSSLIATIIVIGLAVLVAAILVSLFGEPKPEPRRDKES
ncbi:hypothetical protein [Ensifer canadensis]|uniref:hypothetical protein n=1 Tax=Ensifer canadensis TaxID=555315 RepID=UPI0035E3DAFB